MPAPASVDRSLSSPATTRARCAALLALAQRGELRHFELRPGALDAAFGRVARVLAQEARAGARGTHGRLRHLDAGGVPRRAELERRLAGLGARGRAAALVDWVLPSTLLDAGAGEAWRYVDAGGATLGRSEGLAVALLELFLRGFFAADGRSLRCDGARLAQLEAGELAQALQHREDNALRGFEQRCVLLRALGRALDASPVFGGRPSALLDRGDAFAADDLLALLLQELPGIWPNSPRGDVWPHAALGEGEQALVPFHKLTQWLVYSLVEPLACAGVTVHALDRLCVLAEYRNGGLLIDAGVLVPRFALAAGALPARDERVVEWRALTVALFEAARERVLAEAGVGPERADRPALFEWASWQAGRDLARELRADASPPLTVDAESAVF